MKIEYVCDVSKISEHLKNSISWFLEKIKNEGGKCVIVNEITGRYVKVDDGVVLLLNNNGNKISIHWRADGKLHNENGCAYESYYVYGNSIEFSEKMYWHKGYPCYVTNSIEKRKTELAGLPGILILECVKLTNNVWRLNLMDTIKVYEEHYWVTDEDRDEK